MFLFYAMNCPDCQAVLIHSRSVSRRDGFVHRFVACTNCDSVWEDTMLRVRSPKKDFRKMACTRLVESKAG